MKTPTSWLLEYYDNDIIVIVKLFQGKYSAWYIRLMPKPSTQKPAQARSRKTEQELITALERLLSSKAIGELTVAEIAAEAGLTTGAIYRRFKDKQDLLRAAFDRFLEKTEKNSAHLATKGATLENRDLLRLVIGGTLQFTLENIAIMRAASSLNDIPSFGRMKEARNVAADALAEQLTTSSLPADELKRRVRFILRMATAVGRDTFLAGPGAGGMESPSESQLLEPRESMKQLVDDLTDTSVAYLQI